MYSPDYLERVLLGIIVQEHPNWCTFEFRENPRKLLIDILSREHDTFFFFLLFFSCEYLKLKPCKMLEEERF